MLKPGINDSEISKEQKTISEMQVKTKNDLKTNLPKISDTTRVVFSEEINRDSNLDDG